ncbi:MAG: hypothetical protein JXA25_09250 [Anaerolineales bacterium]|nr:hypothetical protein [Anaerolineales bacterium]
MKRKENQATATKPGGTCYTIQLEGVLDPRWMEWFHGVKIESVTDDCGDIRTILLCTGVDQPQLRGILNAIWDLNLKLVSVQPTTDPGAEA